MTMTHQQLPDRPERRRDARTADAAPSCVTLESARRSPRRWAVAQLIATARATGDRSVGA